jgi:hypothetical protein
VADRVAETAERLYGLPLEDFTRERDEAAKALRREKERDAAAEVAKLPKPSAGAWAVNAVAREAPELRDELLAAGEALREAQEAAIAGEGGGAIRAATARERAAVDAVLDAAAKLEPGGRKLSGAALDRLRRTLHAAAGDDEIRAALAAGRLVRDAEGGGAWPFAAAGDEPPPAARPARARKRTAAKRPARADDAEAEARAAERRAAEREAAQRRKALEAELGEARAERRASERELARAEREAERAAERLERAQAAAEEARAHATEAHGELEAARAAVRHARDNTARLEEQLD